MTVKPIDIQVLLPKIQEAGRVQENENDNVKNQQAMFSAELKTEKSIEQRRITGSLKSADTRLNPDKENAKNHSNNPRNNKHKKRHIDIKI